MKVGVGASALLSLFCPAATEGLFQVMTETKLMEFLEKSMGQ